MFRKTIYFSLIIAPLFIIISGANDPQSTGAPPSSTGAPGEPTCAKSGCHTGAAVNSGTGLISAEILGNPISYTPGETYTIRISIDQENIERFGYECASIADNDEASAGTFLITDPARTQVLPGSNEFENREYATYTYNGTAPTETNKGEWTFDWQAPDTDLGSITFYIATVAANNDATDKGDEVYTTQLNISSESTTFISQLQNQSSELICYPNPANRSVTIEFQARPSESLRLTIFDINGRILYSEATIPNVQQELVTRTIDLERLNLKAGLYFVEIENTARLIFQQKFFKL
ncbi:T9SS type A sorting domain-containing protein [bacterium AH-315-C07]|nr:T9SS type A sorting domain-containing protein [bacterium AH-315-C07]